MTFFLRFLVPMWCRNLSGRFSPPWLNRSTQYFAAAACELCVSCLSLSFVKLPQGHASFARSSGMLLSILVPLHTLVIFTSIKSLLLLRRRVYIFSHTGSSFTDDDHAIYGSTIYESTICKTPLRRRRRHQPKGMAA